MIHEYPTGHRFQIVRGANFGFGFKRMTGHWRWVYRWMLSLGWVEVRRWTPWSEYKRLIGFEKDT